MSYGLLMNSGFVNNVIRVKASLVRYNSLGNCRPKLAVPLLH